MKFMNMKSIAFSLLAGLSLAFFAACDTGGGGGTRELPPTPIASPVSITFTGATGIRYFSLHPAQEIFSTRAIHAGEWDIAFAPGRVILTNSGVSARGPGNGGVWATTVFSSNFNDAILTSRIMTSTNVSGISVPVRNTDAYAWIPPGVMGGPSRRVPVNVMTHLGWNYGDGLSLETVFNGNPPESAMFNRAHAFAGHQLHNPPMIPGNPYMPPNLQPLNRVYIIQHRCGTRHSRIFIGYTSGPVGPFNHGALPETLTLNFALLPLGN